MTETISKEQWVRLSEQLKDRVQTRFNVEELDAIERFILIAGQSSVFDQITPSQQDSGRGTPGPLAYATAPGKTREKSVA
jgi:hypothetical protein